MRLWEGICKDLLDFWRGFARIRETLGEYLQGSTRLWERNHKDSLRLWGLWDRICKDLWILLERIRADFGQVLHETLREDLQGFARLWRGFARIHETLREQSQGFVRL